MHEQANPNPALNSFMQMEKHHTEDSNAEKKLKELDEAIDVANGTIEKPAQRASGPNDNQIAIPEV